QDVAAALAFRRVEPAVRRGGTRDLLGLIPIGVARCARRRDAEDQHDDHPDDHPSTHTSFETIARSPNVRERALTLRDFPMVGLRLLQPTTASRNVDEPPWVRCLSLSLL